jgi:hypothetical protein
MALKLGLLGEGLIRTMTSFPTAVIPIALGTIHGIHMAGNQVLLKSTTIGKCSTACSLDSMNIRYPLADMQLTVSGRKVRCGKHR